MSIFTNVLQLCNTCCHPNNVTDDTVGTKEHTGHCDDCGKEFTVMRAEHDIYESMDPGNWADRDDAYEPDEPIDHSDEEYDNYRRFELYHSLTSRHPSKQTSSIDDYRVSLGIPSIFG